MIYGGADPVAPSIAQVELVQRDHSRLQLAVIPEADHGMQLGIPARELLDPANANAERPNAPAYFLTLSAWLDRIGALSASGIAEEVDLRKT